MKIKMRCCEGVVVRLSVRCLPDLRLVIAAHGAGPIISPLFWIHLPNDVPVNLTHSCCGTIHFL